MLQALSRVHSPGGELADARKMGDQGIYDFLSQKVASGSLASK
jgi:hypothetical protein